MKFFFANVYVSPLKGENSDQSSVSEDDAVQDDVYNIEYVPDFEADGDIAQFMYKNDPDFKRKCDRECEEKDLTLKEVFKINESQRIEAETRALENFSTQNKKKSTQTVFDKVMSIMEVKEQRAIANFASKVQMDVSDEPGDMKKTAKYSSLKKKRSNAEVFADLTKENNEKLQDKMLESQREMLGELWDKQKDSTKELTAIILAEERKIATDTTNQMIQGMKEVLQPSVAKAPEKPSFSARIESQEKRLLDFDYSGDFHTDNYLSLRLDSSANGFLQ